MPALFLANTHPDLEQLGKAINVVFNRGLNDGRLCFWALRDIAADEELLVDYGVCLLCRVCNIAAAVLTVARR